VIWIKGDDSDAAEGWLAGLRGSLQSAGRLWVAEPRFIAAPTEPPGNPWAWRPHDQSPLRWDAAGCERLDELPGRPERFGGLVLAGALTPRNDFTVRALLIQIVPLLEEDAPFIAVERNGRYAGAVVRSLRGTDGPTVRSVEELRRLLEVSGLGLEAVFAMPERGGGVARRLVRRASSEAGARWMVVCGRRALREGKLPTGRARWAP
jgi:hypothetical protein